MTPSARVTAPLARFDSAWNRLGDATIRWVPWTWWPLDPPRADRPYGPGEHAVIGAWLAVSFTLSEVVVARQPEELRSTGTRLAIERALTIALSVAAWLAAAGAWDRRAERLRRRPWLRLLGSRA
jgi:hypothetical protein